VDGYVISRCLNERMNGLGRANVGFSLMHNTGSAEWEREGSTDPAPYSRFFIVTVAISCRAPPHIVRHPGSRYIHPYRCCVRPLQAIKHRKKAFGTKQLEREKQKQKGKSCRNYLYHKWARTELPIGSREMGWGWMLGYVCRCTLRVCTRFLFVHTPSFFIHDYSAIAFLSLLSRFSVPSL